tara:strand:+ start:105 stop:236 length:132 start_codon:yes stop_codon:yes gene_type:complete
LVNAINDVLTDEYTSGLINVSADEKFIIVEINLDTLEKDIERY